MRKMIAAVLATLMLLAVFAALPVSAQSTTMSHKDGSTAADAEAIDLVITEVAANTLSIYHGNNNFTGDAFQYIEIYNRGNCAVDLSDYAIVQASYTANSDAAWNNKFEKKIPIEFGDVFASFEDASVTRTYRANCTEGLINTDTILDAGETAIIWFWNSATNAAAAWNYLLSAHDDTAGTFYNFRNYYKNSVGVEIPANTLIVAVYGTNDIAESFALNTSGNKMYGLVKDTFDLGEDVYRWGWDWYERNEDVICMWEHGTGLGATTAEGKSAIYTTADNVPHYYNAFYEKDRTDYVDINNNKCEGFKELGCIWHNEDVTPGTLLPIQWADLDPDRAPASVKGTDADWAATAWNNYVTALVAANLGEEVPSRPEVDLNQDEINVNRNNLGNLDQNVFGRWNYFSETEGNVTKYYRYQNDGYHTEADRVQIPEDEYDMAMVSPLTVAGYSYYTAGGKYYKYNSAADAATAVEIDKTECISVMEAQLSSGATSSQSSVFDGSGTGAQVYFVSGTDTNAYYSVQSDRNFITAPQANDLPLEAKTAEPDSGITTIVWIAVAVIGALGIAVVGGVVRFRRKAAKNELVEEELLIDEDDEF